MYDELKKKNGVKLLDWGSKVMVIKGEQGEIDSVRKAIAFAKPTPALQHELN